MDAAGVLIEAFNAVMNYETALHKEVKFFNLEDLIHFTVDSFRGNDQIHVTQDTLSCVGRCLINLCEVTEYGLDSYSL